MKTTSTDTAGGALVPPPTAPQDGDGAFWYSLIPEESAADFLGLTGRAMQAKRQRGDGPNFVRLSSRCIRYRRIDLRKWAEGLLRASTSDPGQAAA